MFLSRWLEESLGTQEIPSVLNFQQCQVFVLWRFLVNRVLSSVCYTNTREAQSGAKFVDRSRCSARPWQCLCKDCLCEERSITHDSIVQWSEERLSSQQQSDTSSLPSSFGQSRESHSPN